MANAINSAVSSGHGQAVITAGFLGLIFSDIIPTPGDALYFYDQRRLRHKYERGELTAKQYWAKNAAGYYIYNAGWWALVFGVVMLTKGDFGQKMKVAAGMAAGGVVVGVILKNIKKDEENGNGKNNKA